MDDGIASEPATPMQAAAIPLLRLDRFLNGERRRNRISEDAYRHGQARWFDLQAAAAGWTRDPAELVAEIEGIAAEVRAMPPPPRPAPPPPLPEGEVDGPEVVALLRRILSGDAVPTMAGPPARWYDLYHAIGEIHADGWILHLFKRAEGFRYVHRIAAPDGRCSDYDQLSARGSDPADLLEDDEFDRLGEVLDDLEADADATRASLLRRHADGDAAGIRLGADMWLTLKNAPGAPTIEQRLAALERSGGAGLSAADLEFAWDLQEILRSHPEPSRNRTA